MAAIWAKVDALLPMNPKCFSAGFWGTTVFFHLVLLNKAHGLRGEISSAMASPEYLARYIQLDVAMGAATSRDAIRDGLLSAKNANLITITGDGVTLVGWNRSWDGNDSSADRTRKYRKGLAATDCDVTDRHDVTVTDCDDVTKCDDVTPRSDQSRVDQNRSDQSLRKDHVTSHAGDAGHVEAGAKPRPKRKVLDPDKIPEAAHMLAQILGDHVRKNNPDGSFAKLAPATRVARLLTWSDVIRKLNEIDKHSWGQIDEMIAWSQRSNFWAPNVQSGKGLRSNWDSMSGQRSRGPETKAGLAATDIAKLAAEAAETEQ